MGQYIDYGKHMRNATRKAIKEVLESVSVNGLPGNHHFYITFDMRHPKLEISENLRERYKDEMTIVIQNWYDGLSVDSYGFSVTLNFSNKLESMTIPFDALKSFLDPSVEFAVRFESDTENIPTEEYPEKKPIDAKEEKEFSNEKKSGEIVSLESFRKT